MNEECTQRNVFKNDRKLLRVTIQLKSKGFSCLHDGNMLDNQTLNKTKI